MSKIAVIVAAGGPRQNTHFFASYRMCEAGLEHDLILVHRGMAHVRPHHNNCGEVILLNKIIDGVEIPHAAFGSYRFGYQTFADKYDYFIFVSDDVVLRRDCWVKDVAAALSKHPKIGFGGSQIFNGGKKYPHPSHVRAPFWFAKAECLAAAKWEFHGDHDGEMRIGDQLTETGYVGIQVGNKLDLAYDSDEPNHITQLLEKQLFSHKWLREKFYPEDDIFPNLLKGNVSECKIQSPYDHIGVQNYIIDIEPFDGLIYKPSLETARQHLKVKDYGYDIFCV